MVEMAAEEKSPDVFGTQSPPRNRKLSPLCPQCGGKKLWRDGHRQSIFGDDIQRWLCRTCGFRFSDPEEVKNSWSKQKKITPNSEESLKTPNDIVDSRQICVTETKNLVSAAETKTVAGEKETSLRARGAIIEFAFWMQKQGYDSETIENRSYMLQRLVALGANPENPESIKEVIAVQPTWSESYKALMVDSYSLFLKWQKKSWDPPRYRIVSVMGYVPPEKDLNDLIAAMPKAKSAFLQGLKDTGADPGELGAVRDIDVNRTAMTVAINYPVKGHNRRVLRVSVAFIDKIATLPKRADGLIFNYPALRDNYSLQRNTVARKLANQNIAKISFTSFRRWKGTVEYHRTKDLLHVQKLLGHKKIDNTLIYIDYEKAVFGTCENEAYVSRVASNTKEACELIEAGFEYVTGEYSDGGKIFRMKKSLFEDAGGNVPSGKTQAPSAK